MSIRDVTVTITRETRSITRAGFGLPLIFGTGQSAEYKEYETLAAVAEDFDDTPGYEDAEYMIARRIFAQSPRPPKVAIHSSTNPLAGALDALVADHNDWYFLLCEDQAAADIDALAAWAELNGKLYFASLDSADLSGALDGAMEKDRTVVLAHQQADTYPEAAWVGKCAPQDPGSITWKYKKLAGVGASGYTATETSAILDANGNVVIGQGGILHTADGTAMSGEFIDIVRGQDWLTARIKENVFAILANAPKIPYTDAGISQVISGLESALKQGTQAGLIATNDAGQPMYSIDYPTREEVPAETRAERTLPDIYFAATLAGAVHKAEITGVLQV